jgi:chromosome segregation ATPase
LQPPNQELKAEYNKICQRKEDLKTKYRDANKHHSDLSKACAEEAVFIKERHSRLKQRLQATDTTIIQMRQKFNHLDAMVKANASDSANENGTVGDVHHSNAAGGQPLARRKGNNGDTESSDSAQAAMMAETAQELQRYIAGINHTQTHRANLDAERVKLESQLEQHANQAQLFEERHKSRVGVMTSICEQ